MMRFEAGSDSKEPQVWASEALASVARADRKKVGFDGNYGVNGNQNAGCVKRFQPYSLVILRKENRFAVTRAF